MALYLKNARLINWQDFAVTPGDFAVAEGPGGTVQQVKEIPAGAEVLDCGGKYVTRSFGCGHHHVYSELARGMPAPKKIPTNFNEILQYVWWTVDKSLDHEMIEASALACAIECAKNGVTFVIDHHASPFHIKGSLEVIAKAFDRVGLSHLLCVELSDRDGEKAAADHLEETRSYLASGRNGLVGLHASFTVGDKLLAAAVALARETASGLHVHVAEGPDDQVHCERTYGKRIIPRFRDAGVLDFAKTLLVHCLHLDDEERRIISGSPVWLVQNAESNQNNNVGAFDARGLGERLLLGTDGMHSDMLRSCKAAFLANQKTEGVSYPEIYRRFRNASRYLAENGFSGDGENCLVVLDYFSPTELKQENFLGHFIFGLNASCVESVINCGRLVVRERKVLGVDEAAVARQAQEQARRLWKAMAG